MEDKEEVTMEAIMVNHMCFCISAARMLVEFCQRYEKFKYKDIELNKETKQMLKRDYGWERDVLVFLQRAKDSYKAFDYAMQQVCNRMDANIGARNYDSFQMDTNDMLALGILYQSKVWEHPEARKDIHNYIYNICGKPQEDVKAVYTHYMNHANHL